MAEILKNMYNQQSLEGIAQIIKSVYAPFQVEKFLETTMDRTWEHLELKARVRKISMGLGAYLPKDYKEALQVLDQVAALDKLGKLVGSYGAGFFAIFLPDFVELYGQREEDWDLSIRALERYTVYGSSEFAVRPFIINHEERMMTQMYAWSKHGSEHVRRLASEGCRPQLPWGQALSMYKKNPANILPILEQLKADPSLYVRKSVANNLNDISKTHPDLVVGIAKKWYGNNEHTDWIIKHGCRTMLKKGNCDILHLFGYDDVAGIEVEDFKLQSDRVSMGGTVIFSFTITTKDACKTRVEYGMDYMRSNGKCNRKIFQISDTVLGQNDKKSYVKNHSFAILSTRKYYPGTHTITLIVNGVERASKEFQLEIGRAH